MELAHAICEGSWLPRARGFGFFAWDASRNLGTTSCKIADVGPRSPTPGDPTRGSADLFPEPAYATTRTVVLGKQMSWEKGGVKAGEFLHIVGREINALLERDTYGCRRVRRNGQQDGRLPRLEFRDAE